MFLYTIYIWVSIKLWIKQQALHSCQKPLYQYIIDNGGWDLFEFVIFQEYTNVNREFLLSKEREYIELYKPRYNFNRPIITEKERNYREKLRTLQTKI